MQSGSRTIGALAMTLGVTLGIAGCGEAESTRPAASAGTTTPRVAFVGVANEQNFDKEMATGFTVAVRQVGGVESSVEGPARMDNAAEAKVFEEVLRTGKAPDGVTMHMQAADLFAPLLADAHAKNIPIIAVDNKMDPTSGVELYVGNDNYMLGQTLADQVIKQLPADAKGDVVIGTPVPGVPVLELRAKGIRDEFAKRLPDVDVLGPFDSKQDPLVNLTAWTNLVDSNPDALAFMGTGDADAYNLAGIRKKRKAKWLAAAFDLDPKSLAAVKEGNLLLVSPEHFVKGAVAGRLQAQHAKDRARPLPKGWIYTPGLAVTRENIDEIMKRQASESSREAWFTPRVDEILRDQQTYVRPLNDAR